MKVFIEQQRFTQLWIIVLIIFSTIVPVGIILTEAKSMESSELVIALSVVILAPAIIFLFKLKTRIDEKGIHYRFIPFHLKTQLIPWSDIDKIYVRNYNPISEYGGWGIKGGSLWNKKKGTAVNVKGDVGIQLELKNNKKLLIGTQLRNQVENTIETYKHKINTNS
ncbi:MAG: hypothetical protein HRU26_06195 [Psychroserpens sp.]|nr:hypothetical protein [Psychroserpens sp.]